MWLFLNNAMLSIVAHRTRPADLMVRARLRGDLEAVFPGYRVTETPLADYRFRCVVPREKVAAVIYRSIERIDYPNFKDSVRDPSRHRAYLSVWQVMVEEQERQKLEDAREPEILQPPPPKKKRAKKVSRP